MVLHNLRSTGCLSALRCTSRGQGSCASAQGRLAYQGTDKTRVGNGERAQPGCQQARRCARRRNPNYLGQQPASGAPGHSLKPMPRKPRLCEVTRCLCALGALCATMPEGAPVKQHIQTPGEALPGKQKQILAAQCRRSHSSPAIKLLAPFEAGFLACQQYTGTPSRP